jgi:hypothetical protein
MARKAIAAGVMVAMLTAPIGPVLAKSVCYGVKDIDQGTPLLRIDVSYHSKLTTSKEARKWGELNPVQKTYSAHGLSILWDQYSDYYMGTLDGSVTVAQRVGARMGLTYAGNSGDPYSTDRIVQYACVSDEASATPETWDCNTFELTAPNSSWTPVELERVDPLAIGLCSVFSLRFHTPQE